MAQDLTDWNYLMTTLWQRVRRRGWALGGEWPRRSFGGLAGTVTSASQTAGTITDNTQNWPIGGWSGSSTAHVYGPRFFDLIIDYAGDNNTPQKVLHWRIRGNNATTLNVTPLDCDPVVGGQVMSWNDLVGKPFYIISAESPDRGLWWSERIPQWPRARSRYRGIVDSVVVDTSDATLYTLALRYAHFSVNQFATYHLIYNTTDGIQRRVAINSNTTGTIKINSPIAPSSGQTINIIAASGLWHNNDDEKIFSWTQSPMGIVDVTDFDFVNNVVVDNFLNGFDVELWGEYDIPQIAQPDRCYTPDWLKTFRGLQVTLENFAPSFVPVGNYDGATTIPTYTLNGAFEAAGLPDSGWRRYFPREFRYAYDKTAWIPDDSGHPVCAEDGYVDGFFTQQTGYYQTRGKSTTNSEYGPDGQRSSCFTTSDGTKLIANGQIARYIGDNHGDGFDMETDGRFFTQEQPPSNIVPNRPKNVIGGTVWSITDTGANWDGGALITHTGTATSGSQNSLTDSTQAASSFWIHPDRGRWLNHWVEIQTGTDVLGNPVWEGRPITSHTTTTIGWDVPISVTTNNKPYRIREPNAELNRYKDRFVKLIDTTGVVVARAKIAYNSYNTLWFTVALANAPQPGWQYVFEELKIGGSYLRSNNDWIIPTGTDNRPNRGGVKFPRSVLAIPPDVIAANGRFMKGDYVSKWLFDDMTAFINLLQWTKSSVTWMIKSADDALNENNRRIGDGDAEDITTPYPGPYNLSAIFTLAKNRAQSGYLFDPYDSMSFTDGSQSGGPIGDPYYHSPAASSQAFIERNECDAHVEAVYGYPRTVVFNELSANVDFMAFVSTDAGALTAFLDVPWDGSEETFTGETANLKYAKWSKVTSGTTDENGVAYGGKVGGNPPAIPSPDSLVYGYAVSDQIAIIKWNMN